MAVSLVVLYDIHCATVDWAAEDSAAIDWAPVDWADVSLVNLSNIDLVAVNLDDVDFVATNLVRLYNVNQTAVDRTASGVLVTDFGFSHV